MQRAPLLCLLFFTACGSSSVSDAGLFDTGAAPAEAGMGSSDTGVDAGLEPSDSGADAGVEPADSGADAGVAPADSGADAGVEPADSGADAGMVPADGGAAAIQCGQPFHFDQDPDTDNLGRLGVYAATGQATALTYTNLSDYSDHLLFHDGTSSTALELLFTAAEFNGSGSGEAAQGAARGGFAAFIAPQRINDGSGVIARRSITAGTWSGPTVGRNFGAGTNSLAILEDGRVLVGGPSARPQRQLQLVTYDLGGSFSATVAIAAFPVERISETQLAVGAGDHGALLALTTDGVIHGYAIRAGVLDPTDVTLTPPVPATALAVAPLPGGDVYVVWNESGTGATTRASVFHYDPGTSMSSFGPTEDIAPNAARLNLQVDANGNLTLLRASGGHLLVYRRIGGAWSAPMDFGLPTVNGPETLALDAEGTAYVTYWLSGAMYLSRAPALSTTWEAPVMIASAPSSNSHAIGAVGARGVVVTYNTATRVGGGTDVYGILCR